MTSAEDLRQEGNTCFSAKRYDEALKLYEQAIALDSQNILLHNNAAAAHHALQQYDEAISCARRSLSVQANYKAHARIGAALWAMGRLQEALHEYDAAATLTPGNSGVEEARQSLRRLLSASPLEIPTRPHGVVGAALDALITVLSLFTIIGFFLFSSLSQMTWAPLMIACVAREMTVAQSRGLLRANSAVLLTWADHRCTLAALLCGLALFSGVAVQPMLVAPLGIYAITSLAANRELPPMIRQPLSGLFSYVSANEMTLILYAASMESLMLFTVMLSGGAIFTLVFIQYVKNIYRIDRNIRFAFSGLRANVGRITRHPYAPPFIDRYMQKFFDLLYTMSQNSF